MRIEKLRASLGREEGCLIENPVDLLYLTGLNLSKGKLWVTHSHAALFVDGRYYEMAQKTAPCSVHTLEQFKTVFSTVKQAAFDSAFVTCYEFSNLQKNFPEVEWVPLPNPLKLLRLCKEPREIAALKRAADLTGRGYRQIVTSLKEGVSEAELALEFEIFCRKNGASGLSFQPIIAFGENSAYPHHRAGLTRLKKDQIVLIDIGAIVDQYCGDMTRIVYFGKPDPQLLRLDQIVKKAQAKAIDLVRPGVTTGELDRAVREIFDAEHVKPLYTHSLGHGIGLETHEFPIIKAEGADQETPLKPGMVFTIEPGLYQVGLGGIRWEDMVLVTEHGAELLTHVEL